MLLIYPKKVTLVIPGNAKIRPSGYFYFFLTLFLLNYDKKMLLLELITTTIEPFI
jgi:hypothetical protein